MLLKIIKNRNFILISALVAGLSYDAFALQLKDFTVWILAVVMTFSLSGISFKMLTEYKSILKISLHALLLNYLIFGTLALSLAYFLFDDRLLLMGFVVIAATPPGVAIIPFSFVYKGDTDYAFKGVLGTYLISIILTPLIIGVFAAGTSVDSVQIIMVIFKVLILPLILSRLLKLQKISAFTEKYRGKVIDLGFALIIYTAIGLNRNAFFSDMETLLKIAAIMFVLTFASGTLYTRLMKRRIDKKRLISHDLMLTIKSSGFAVATSLALFDEKASIPAAVMSVFVLLYLLFVGVKGG